jgi:hypothetical protein
VRYSGLLLLAALALGCAHRPKANAQDANHAMAQAGDEVMPVREARDVVGHYRGLFGAPEAMTIREDAGALVMEYPLGARHPVTIRDDGTLAVTSTFGARLLRRGARTLLEVRGCYIAGLLERVDRL